MKLPIYFKKGLTPAPPHIEFLSEKLSIKSEKSNKIEIEYIPDPLQHQRRLMLLRQLND